jgi:hypothetical protein
MTTAKITDRSDEARRRYREAARLGVDAAANTLEREVVLAHDASYYKGGAFRGTLLVRQSIRRAPPTDSGRGWVSKVGTKIIQALFWELGHHNLFTRKYERVRLWVPTAQANVERMKANFAAIVARVMNAPARGGTTRTVQ